MQHRLPLTIAASVALLLAACVGHTDVVGPIADRGSATLVGGQADEPLHYTPHVSQAPEGAHQWVNITQIRQVYDSVDDGHTQWFATSGGLVAFERGRSTPRVFTSMDSGLPDTHVSCVAIAPRGRLWVGTMEGHIARYEQDKDQWTVFYERPRVARPSSLAISKIVVGEDGAVWAVVRGGVVFGHEGIWTSFMAEEVAPLGGDIRSIAPYGGDKAWVATSPILRLQDFLGNMRADGGGIGHFDGETWTIHREGERGLPSDAVRHVEVDSLGQVLALTDKGAVRWTGEVWEAVDAGELEDLVGEPGPVGEADVMKASPLGRGSMADIYLLGDDSVFVAFSHEHGLHFDGAHRHRRPYPENPDFRFSFSSAAVSPQGQLWAVFTLGHIRVYDGEQWRDETYPGAVGPYPSGARFGADGRLYLVGRESGLFVREHDGSWTHVMPEARGIGGSLEPEAGPLWVTGVDSRSLLVEQVPNDFKEVEVAAGKYPRISQPVVDSRGRAWVQQGASAPDPRSRIIVYGPEGPLKEGFENVAVRLLGAARDGRVWVQLDDGRVGRMDAEGFEFEALDLPPLGGARKVVESEAGRVWILHSEGVIAYRPGSAEHL